ncbi:MAG TPA: M14 family zinc carboxypeptidase, partial [bacterium]
MMKKAIGLLWATLLLACVATAQDRGIYSLPQSAREALIEMKATVRHGSLGGDYIAELTPAEVLRLRRQGIEPVLLFASAAEEEAARRRWDETDEFHTYDQMRSAFYTYAAAHPAIAQVVVLGYSIENRELFAMKISDNVAVEEDEPELAFWGNIHGNEYGGGEMPYLYALYLLDNYSINPAVAARVDNNEIWCVPLINPDGRVHGIRNNMNNVDLNRDFGYQWDGWGGSDAPFGEVETRTVREFCLENNISLSTTFHCSGDVVFYQWGYSPNPAPDHNVIFRVGQRYAQAASYAFENSWDDYETHGETLDFVYGSLGGLCYTVEVSNSSSSVNQTFARNQAGMNFFCDLAGQGLHGTVTDSSTGQAILAAVWISGSSIPAYTDPELGDLHRLVLPGIYN